MKKTNRIEVARIAIETALSQLSVHGKEVEDSSGGVLREMRLGTLHICHTSGVRLLPTESRLKELLDIWEDGSGKVFSACWEPLEIILLKPGGWISAIEDSALRRTLH